MTSSCQRRARRPVQHAEQGGQWTLCRREVDPKRPHPQEKWCWTSSAARRRKARWFSATAFPGFPRAWRTAPRASKNSLKATPGLTVLGPFDVKVERGRQLQSLGTTLRRKSGRRRDDPGSAPPTSRAPRQAQRGQWRQVRRRRIHDLTAENLAAIKDKHAYVSLGQSPSIQGIPAGGVLLVDAIKAKKPLPVGFFYDAGTQVVTADSVSMGNGLPGRDFRAIAEARGRPESDRRILSALGEELTGAPQPRPGCS